VNKCLIVSLSNRKPDLFVSFSECKLVLL